MNIKKVSYVEIMHEDWDDGDPLYEVEFGIEFDDGTFRDYRSTWVRTGHLDNLNNNNVVEVSKYIAEYHTSIEDITHE